jgi:hypothetical protein
MIDRLGLKMNIIDSIKIPVPVDFVFKHPLPIVPST